jgi:hypothetical protein
VKYGPGIRRVEFLLNSLAVVYEAGREQNARQYQVTTTTSSYTLDDLHSLNGVSELGKPEAFSMFLTPTEQLMGLELL